MGRGYRVVVWIWCLVSVATTVESRRLLLARCPVPFTDHRPLTTDHSTPCTPLPPALSSALLLSVDLVSPSPNDSELTHRYGAHDARVSHTLAQAGTRGDQGGRLKAHMSIEQQRGIRWRGLRRHYTGARCCRLRWLLRCSERGALFVSRSGHPVWLCYGTFTIFFYSWWGAIVDGSRDRCVSVWTSCALRIVLVLTLCTWRC